MINVALVEDNRSMRHALERSLRDFPDRVRVAVSAASAEELVDSMGVIDIANVSVLVADLRLPGMSGAELIRNVALRRPEISSVALTLCDDEPTVLETIAAGACGYVLKSEPIEQLVRAIEEAVLGAHPVSSRVVGYLVGQARLRPGREVITEREEQVARGLAQGLSYAECSESMGIKLGTVQEYVKRLYRKLGLNSRRELQVWAARNLPK